MILDRCKRAAKGLSGDTLERFWRRKGMTAVQIDQSGHTAAVGRGQSAFRCRFTTISITH
jgi:hypothetical protein